ncbi:MAG: hypothetical protein KY439_10840 [Actinobacteria bacterium]|nr:hypothetical protein [Actinomycetota bacterium]
MTHDVKIVRRLVGAVAGAGLVGALSMGSAGAALVEHQENTGFDVSRGVEKCVTVAVPTATATVNAKLKVSAAGANFQRQQSTTVSSGDLGTLKVCVEADAAADVSLDAHAVADAGLGGTTVNVSAEAVAETAVDVNVTVNGQEVL